jgi:hypothetical protein
MIVPPQKFITPRQDSTDSGGQGVSVWFPQGVTGPAPLVIFNHQQGGIQGAAWNNAVNYVKVLQHACNQEGWIFASSANHGADGWSSTNAQGDLTNLYNYVNAIVPVSKTVLAGASMGGCLSAMGLINNKVPNVKGLLTFDGAFGLGAMYANTYDASINGAFGITAGTVSTAASSGATSISLSVSFPSGTNIRIGYGTANDETVQVTGTPTGAGPYATPVTALTKSHALSEKVSDYPDRTNGFDPTLQSSAAFPNTRYMLVTSTADTTCVKANNTDALSAKITTFQEKTVPLHLGGHLSTAVDPTIAIPFLRRCFA